jgi:hypothetical protein
MRKLSIAADRLESAASRLRSAHLINGMDVKP